MRSRGDVLAVVAAFLSLLALAVSLQGLGVGEGSAVFITPSIAFSFLTIFALTSGEERLEGGLL